MFAQETFDIIEYIQYVFTFLKIVYLTFFIILNNIFSNYNL